MCINGVATTSYAIRGELNYNKKRKKPSNIYWNYREDKGISKNTIKLRFE
jgi:hypothetical protein